MTAPDPGIAELRLRFSVEWAMPSRWTFSIPPIAEFCDRWLEGKKLIVDPFAGQSTRAHLRNDLGQGGIDAVAWLESLLPEYEGRANAVLFDPPYSPRQISECYQQIGRKATMADTQDAALRSRVKPVLSRLLAPGGVALSFGWQSCGMGREWETHEIMLVQHGGGHNDTICVAQTKPMENQLMFGELA